MSLRILPLAITMMAGPQIMAAIIFVTVEEAVRVSLTFLVGVAAAATVGVAVARGLAALLGNATSLGQTSDTGSIGTTIQVVLVGLLLVAAARNYLGRKTAEPPEWLGTLLSATPAKAFRTGFLLILLMPSDIAVMLTVGIDLEQNGASVGAALPFVGATVGIAALPLLAYLLFRQRAEQAMPRARDWMNTHSWLVNIIVCFIFIALVLSGG